MRCRRCVDYSAQPSANVCNVDGRVASNVDVALGCGSLSQSRVETALLLAAARKQAASKEILLWMTPSEAPKALQASECSELLDPMRASCWISAQH
jgi:hypothetical protein